MKIKNRITNLFNIQYPVIQGGMVWVSGWKLASAVSNNGGLGLIGAGSMKPELLVEHIQKCKLATNKPFGVNIPLLRKDSEELVNESLNAGVKIFFTSAGHPGKYIDVLKKHNAKVVHVVSNLKQAKKAEDVGCDAVVCEGVEAGGHNGSDELTTFCLIPHVAANIKIPVIAAGGIATGSGIAAAFALGAEGVQIGTLFAVSKESSASEIYKQKIVEASATDSTLLFRKIGLVRTLKNDFTNSVKAAEDNGANSDLLKELLATKREFKGIFEGNFTDGLMETGQAIGVINQILSVEEIFKNLINEYNNSLSKLNRTSIL